MLTCENIYFKQYFLFNSRLKLSHHQAVSGLARGQDSLGKVLVPISPSMSVDTESPIVIYIVKNEIRTDRHLAKVMKTK